MPNRRVYDGIRDELIVDILEGRYTDGEQVPPVRSVALKTGASLLTVGKAYRELVDGGVLKVRRGVGCFVADGSMHKLRRRERERFLAENWPEIINEIKRLGLGRKELLGSALASGNVKSLRRVSS